MKAGNEEDESSSGSPQGCALMLATGKQRRHEGRCTPGDTLLDQELRAVAVCPGHEMLPVDGADARKHCFFFGSHCWPFEQFRPEPKPTCVQHSSRKGEEGEQRLNS